jgi:phage shock protein PspC (stress-responsive transcriptional regulator)
MHKVITINLNGQVFQIDERGYEALRAYLEQAEAQLGANPDKCEIVRDLEQSIAEKFTRLLDSGGTIVATADVEQVLQEIGPVDGGTPAASGHTAAGTGGGPAKRLYLVREGAMLAGLCNGIAAYFGIDPTFIRIAFVAAAIVEIAVFDRPPVLAVGLYAILVLMVPYANTPSERAAAHGGYESIPARVQHSVERVKGMFGGVRRSAH